MSRLIDILKQKGWNGHEDVNTETCSGYKGDISIVKDRYDLTITVNGLDVISEFTFLISDIILFDISDEEVELETSGGISLKVPIVEKKNV